MDLRYCIEGGVPLEGEVIIGGSKNAALPLLAASLLIEGETVLTNVPHIRDVDAMLHILEFLGANVSFLEGTVRVQTQHVQNRAIPHELVKCLRGSIVLLGPLLARFGSVEMAYPGGCVLGKRPIGAHIRAFECMGCVNRSTEDIVRLHGKPKGGVVILPEFSVTATENALLASAFLQGETIIHLAACEPHVRDLIRFLKAAGVTIHSPESHTYHVRGASSLQSLSHRVCSDYLETGAFVVAALVTRGKICLREVEKSDLLCFLAAVQQAGGVWHYDEIKRSLTIDGRASCLRAVSIRTNVFPGFPTDLQAPFAVMMTQAEGISRIFERLYERRLGYIYELEKMGARVEILNGWEALIFGPARLRGRTVASHDIRAGVAMVLAALCAEGESILTDVHYIERGYDRLEQKLQSVGARIERIEGVHEKKTWNIAHISSSPVH